MVTCPLCGLPAEIISRFVAPTEPGGGERVTVRCPLWHWFSARADELEVSE